LEIGKNKKGETDWVDRFELFISGREFSTTFSKTSYEVGLYIYFLLMTIFFPLASFKSNIL